MKGLRGFDGKLADPNPLKRFKEIKREGLPHLEVLNEANLRNENGDLTKESLSSESYSLSAFIIEQMWEELKKREGTYSDEDTPRVPLDDDFWKNFADRYVDLEVPVVNWIFSKFKDLANREIESLSLEEKLIFRFYAVNIILMEEGFREDIFTPSFVAFFSLYTRLARVAEERFYEQYNREITRKEFEHLISDSSFRNIMLDLMTNSRTATLHAVGILEGNKLSENLEDTSRSFVANDFVIKEKGNGPILQVSEELVAEVHKSVKDLIENQKQKGKDTPQVLRCPVIYTDKFKEMCEWMNHEFTHHYLEQKYPFDQSRW